MKSANEVAVELQAKYDYFFAAAILASLGFSIHLNVTQDKITFISYITALIAFSISAICCFYRLQQKPRVYELHAVADDARIHNRVNALIKAETQAKLYEKNYELAYFLMCISFVLGAIAIAATKLLPLYSLLFCLN